MDEKDVILSRLMEQNAALQKQAVELQRQRSELEKQNACLLELVDSQAEEIRRLTTRIGELEDEVARLKKNSLTSSKPPSSDIVKPGPKASRRKGKRPPPRTAPDRWPSASKSMAIATSRSSPTRASSRRTI